MFRTGSHLPHFKLPDIHALVDAGRFDIKMTVFYVLRYLLLVDTRAQAKALAEQVVRELEDGDFVKAVRIGFQDADEYGRVVGGMGWYVKVYIDIDGKGDEIAWCWSLHPPEAPLTTKSGMINVWGVGWRNGVDAEVSKMRKQQR